MISTTPPIAPPSSVSRVEPTASSASRLARLIATRTISAREVVEAHIQRIEAVQPWLNAVVVPLFDQARRAADSADAAIGAGRELGPLHGVPITIKEHMAVAGTVATLGTVSRRGVRADADGPLVARLERAGAIVLGKTNVAQLLAYPEADNPLYGRTNNPWSRERTPGGSSGGEAAIIAVGGSALGIGTDLGGSIRDPAHFCGIHGFKPTTGRLSTLDSLYSRLLAGPQAILPQPGPMARTVADLSLAMQVLAAPGQEQFDTRVAPVAWRDPGDVVIANLRVAVYTDDGCFPVSPAIRRCVGEAAEALRARGVRVLPWRPPGVERAMHLFLAILTSDGADRYRQALADGRPDRRISLLLRAAGMAGPLRLLATRALCWTGQDRMARVLSSMGPRSAQEYFALVQELNEYRSMFTRSLSAGGYDAILCPPCGLPALRHGDSAMSPDFESYARLFNVLGWPAGVVAATRVRPDEESERIVGRDPADRCARSVEHGSTGLPVGVQMASRPFREDIALALMAALEAHSPAMTIIRSVLLASLYR